MSLTNKVRVNDSKSEVPVFTSGVIGKDNTIARHGIHGLYWLFNVDVSASLLINGVNTVFLTQTISSSGPLQGIMYDYIRFEASPSSIPSWYELITIVYFSKTVFHILCYLNLLLHGY